MSVPINWSDLERRGLITPPPGREEAERIVLAKVAARKAAQQEEVQSKRSKSK